MALLCYISQLHKLTTLNIAAQWVDNQTFRSCYWSGQNKSVNLSKCQTIECQLLFSQGCQLWEAAMAAVARHERTSHLSSSTHAAGRLPSGPADPSLPSLSEVQGSTVGVWQRGEPVLVVGHLVAEQHQLPLQLHDLCVSRIHLVPQLVTVPLQARHLDSTAPNTAWHSTQQEAGSAGQAGTTCRRHLPCS